MEKVTRRKAVENLCDLSHAIATSIKTGIGFGEETGAGLLERIVETMQFIIDNTDEEAESK